MKKILLLILSLVTLGAYAQGIPTDLVAMPDTFTVVQAHVDTLDVTANDTISVGDSVCIILLGSPAHFTVLSCSSIIYHPDSPFTGRDTCVYILCDTAHICDTATVVVYVDSLIQLLPVAGFKDDSIYGDCAAGQAYFLLSNCNGLCNNYSPGQYQLSSTSLRSDSLHWSITDIDYGAAFYDSVKYYNTDTVNFSPAQLWDYLNNPYPPFYLEVCLTAYNQYGSRTICDTSCQLWYEGIAEVPLANIRLYPSPASSSLTIDMQQCSSAITSTYTSISLYDALGQRIRSIPRQGTAKVVDVSVASMPDGIYMATITDVTGTEMMQGKFTVLK